MSKFLQNLLLKISKALVNSKNPIFNSEIIFFLFSAQPTPQPAWPLAQPAHWSRHPPQAKSARPAHPARASIASSREIHFPFQSTPPEPAAFSLCHRHAGPTCRLHRLPRAGRPRLEISPRRRSPAPLPRASDAPELLHPSLITLPP
jgi:hypothetical protein